MFAVLPVEEIPVTESEIEILSMSLLRFRLRVFGLKQFVLKLPEDLRLLDRTSKNFQVEIEGFGATETERTDKFDGVRVRLHVLERESFKLPDQDEIEEEDNSIVLVENALPVKIFKKEKGVLMLDTAEKSYRLLLSKNTSKSPQDALKKFSLAVHNLLDIYSGQTAEVPLFLYEIPCTLPNAAMQGFWKGALNQYLAKDLDPLMENWIFWSNERFRVIYDRYWKAEIHLLVLPRSNNERYCKFEVSKLESEDLDMLREMRRIAVFLINGMGRSIEEYRIGFHAIPSMDLLHLHVIVSIFSSNFLSLKLKLNFFLLVMGFQFKKHEK